MFCFYTIRALIQPCCHLDFEARFVVCLEGLHSCRCMQFSGGIIATIAPKGGCCTSGPWAASRELCGVCAPILGTSGTDKDSNSYTVWAYYGSSILVGEGLVVLFRCHHVSSSRFILHVSSVRTPTKDTEEKDRSHLIINRIACMW